ncbi:hypothetical protein BKA69DRAFT_1171518 [Paraphysoderma sedebokerense]|nr:hypothetical protein BKA69DRAFT_1171518 [Paraphysoderma sedebokerense]
MKSFKTAIVFAIVCNMLSMRNAAPTSFPASKALEAIPKIGISGTQLTDVPSTEELPSTVPVEEPIFATDFPDFGTAAVEELIPATEVPSIENLPSTAPVEEPIFVTDFPVFGTAAVEELIPAATVPAEDFPRSTAAEFLISATDTPSTEEWNL